MMKKIIFSGATCTGKTSVLEAIQERGYAVFGEGFRELLQANSENIEQDNFYSNPLFFSEKIWEYRKSGMESQKNGLQFFDRSLVDVLAYLEMDNTEYPEEWRSVLQSHQYKTEVYFFPLWKEIFANDAERVEAWEMNEAVDAALRREYEKYGFRIVEVPKYSIEERVEWVLSHAQIDLQS